ncbi:hypothetical protein OESDEN_06653 [Oesophagostomum dentatum]|uniref:Tc1-like transposase DDE domain-containing protein n=1 Tax=Oesophagostomum dentatum TaxID=61180 RepID=A0A0B1TBB0_OESDE|nr:hypothetical protein OESDEN_06653 [Oesophagostomum dentatum]
MFLTYKKTPYKYMQQLLYASQGVQIGKYHLAHKGIESFGRKIRAAVIKEGYGAEFYFWYNCGSSEGGAAYKKFIYIHSYVIAFVMTAMYIVIYVKLKWYFNYWKANKTASLKREVQYLIQTLLICILIMVEIVSFIFLPYLGISGYGKFYVNMLLNLILIANNMMTPTEKLEKLAAAIREKRHRRALVHLLHDNARPHVAKETQQKLATLGWETVVHPPYSPDLAPSEYLLFRPLKHHLAGRKFTNYDNLKSDIADVDKCGDYIVD